MEKMCPYIEKTTIQKTMINYNEEYDDIVDTYDMTVKEIVELKVY